MTWMEPKNVDKPFPVWWSERMQLPFEKMCSQLRVSKTVEDWEQVVEECTRLLDVFREAQMLYPALCKGRAYHSQESALLAVRGVGAWMVATKKHQKGESSKEDMLQEQLFWREQLLKVNAEKGRFFAPWLVRLISKIEERYQAGKEEESQNEEDILRTFIFVFYDEHPQPRERG